MQSKFSLDASQRQIGAGFGLTRDRNRAKMRGQKPANHLCSTQLPTKTAHLCAISPTDTPKTPPLTSPNWKNTKRTHSPLIMSRSLTRNKRLSSKHNSPRFGFVRSVIVQTNRHCDPRRKLPPRRRKQAQTPCPHAVAGHRTFAGVSPDIQDKNIAFPGRFR